MNTDILYAVLTQHLEEWIGVLFVIENPTTRVGPRRIELQAVDLDRLALVGQRLDRGCTIRRIDSSEHHSPHVGDRHRTAHHRGARARQRFEKMLPALAHLTDAAGTPPHMGLGIDEDRRAGRLVIGNPLYCQPVDVLLGGRKSMCLARPKGENRGATRKLERSSARQCLSERAIETAFYHEPIPAWRCGPTDNPRVLSWFPSIGGPV